MAMTMTGDIQLHANREAVWAKLNDPAVLKSLHPGLRTARYAVRQRIYRHVDTNRLPGAYNLERIPLMLKRSLHGGKS